MLPTSCGIFRKEINICSFKCITIDCFRRLYDINVTSLKKFATFLLRKINPYLSCLFYFTSCFSSGYHVDGIEIELSSIFI